MHIILCQLPFLLLCLWLTLEEMKREENNYDKNRVLPSFRFATLALILGDIHIVVGQGNPRKQQVGA